MSKIIQTLPATTRIPLGATDVVIPLKFLKDTRGNYITSMPSGVPILYGTLEPRSDTFQETISFTGIQDDGNNKVTLTGVTRNINPRPPYDALTPNVPHGNNVEFILSNSGVFYKDFLNSTSDADISASFTFPDPVYPKNPATKDWVEALFSGTGTITYDRQMILGVVGENVIKGNVVYFKESDQKWWKSGAGNTLTFEGQKLAIIQSDTITANSSGLLVLTGNVTLSGLTAGSKYYLSDTSGGITTSDAQTNKVYLGVALSTTVLLFDPNAIINAPTSFVTSSAGAGDAGKGIKLDPTGKIDKTFIPASSDFPTGVDGDLKADNPTGTISSTSGVNVTGSGTLFTTELSVGDKIICAGQTRTIATIVSNTSLTTTVAFSPTVSGTMYKVKVIDLAGSKFYFKSFNSISITGSSYIECINPSNNGTILHFKTKNNTVITTNASEPINLKDIGASFGYSGTSTFYKCLKGNGGGYGSNTGGGGGGGGGMSSDGVGGNNGDGSSNGAGGAGGIGNEISKITSKIISCGASGGAGGSSFLGGGGAGGAGGGALIIDCFGDLNITSTLNSNGKNGLTGFYGGSGGGGGGAGGAIVIISNTISVNTATINVSGGSGAVGVSNGGYYGGTGGAGGNGYSFIGLRSDL